MAVINGESMFSHYVGFKRAFRDAFDGAENVDQWSLFSTLVPSDTREEVYQWMGQTPQMREWIGPRVVREMLGSEYRIKNKSYELTYGVNADDLEDGRNPDLIFQFNRMGRAAARWPNKICFEVLKDSYTGGPGAGLVGFDGQPLFSAAHPVDRRGDDGVVAATTESNFVAGGGEPWILVDDTQVLGLVIMQLRQQARFVRKDAPEDEGMFHKRQALYGVDSRGAAAPGLWHVGFMSRGTLNQTNFEDAFATMTGRKNEENESLGIRPTILMVGSTNEAAARALLLRQFIDGGNTNPNFNRVALLVTNLLD
ncbi:MAG: Mu-like prophage major head subunit gpT family protein [Myxococcota bacterium]